MGALAVKTLRGDLKKAFKVDHPNLLFLATEDNIFEWHVMIVGLPAPYLGGELIFRLEPPKEFPHKPPEPRFCTPNGVYMVGEKICTPVGEVHAEDRLEKDHGAYGWQPVMGLTGFAVQVLNGLICPEVLYETEHSDGDQRSLGILDKSAKERQELSDASRNYNICHHPALRKQFEELVRAKPALKAAQAWAQQNARADLLEKIEDWPVMNRAISDKYIKRFIGSELWTDFMHWVDEVDDHDELWYREILRQADLRILLELDPSMINVGLRYILLEYIGRRSRFAIHRCIFRFTDSVPCLAPFLPLLLAKAFDNFRFYDSEDLDCLRRAMMAGTSQDFAALDQIYTKMLRTCSVEQREKLKYYIREFRKTDFQWVQMLRVSGWGKKFY